MRLLITTQTVDADDPVLGFFHEWIAEFARHTEHVDVICLREGRHALPPNVAVHSLGKRDRRLSRIVVALRVIAWSWRLRHSYGRVFVHMNPEYLAVAGWLWRLLGKRAVLWYSHRNVDLKLRIAARFANAIATASAESFSLSGPKVHAIGHGVDLARFSGPHDTTLHDPLTVVSVGRVTPIKDLETLIRAVALLRTQGSAVCATLIGAPVTATDHSYAQSLHVLVEALGVADAVIFAGALPNNELPSRYRDADISINLCPTGGIDKAVLESAAAGCLVLVANRAFAPYLGSYADRLTFAWHDPESLAAAVRTLVSADDRESVRATVSQNVRAQASVSGVVSRIMALLA